MKAAPKRKWMVNALREHLVPEFVRIGFELVPFEKTESRDLRSFHQLGRLKRRKRDGIEQVEISMSDAPRSSFAVYFGFISNEGITIRGEGWRSAEELRVAEARVINTLSWCTRNPFSDWWWVVYWPWQTPCYERHVTLANRIASYVPEIEDFFNTGRVGPHVRQRDEDYEQLSWVKLGKHDPNW